MLNVTGAHKKFGNVIVTVVLLFQTAVPDPFPAPLISNLNPL